MRDPSVRKLGLSMVLQERAQKFEKGGRNFLFPLKISGKTKKEKRSLRVAMSNSPPKSSENQKKDLHVLRRPVYN